MIRSEIAFSFLIIILVSCSSKQEHRLSYDREIYSPAYSSGYRISGEENSDNVLITSLNPWQGATDVASQLLIVRDSLSRLDSEENILKEDAKRIITMSSTHIAMLDALDALDRIVGVSGKEYISNEKLMSSSKFIPDIGYEGNIDYEALVATNPDLVLLFSVNGASAMEPKLKELGIPFIYIGDYVEESPLGKTEWIIPLAEIIGKREEGQKKFKEIEERYITLKDKVKSLKVSRPTVMLNAPFGDSWFMPSTKSYVARMMEDAGADYIYKKNTGNSSLPIDLEAALMLVSHADYWLNIGTMDNLEEVKRNFPKFVKADCVQEGRLYNNNARKSIGGGNDCYESGVVNPDLILRDLVKIFHPELVEEDFVYYHKLE